MHLIVHVVRSKQHFYKKQKKLTPKLDEYTVTCFIFF